MNRTISGIFPPGGHFQIIRKIALVNNDTEQIRIKAVAYSENVTTLAHEPLEQKPITLKLKYSGFQIGYHHQN
ncbi:unnamed protein product [Adineta steineri]|uniref:Uncharacterized protein n=1 Tax=Adineta steineri TaxID=433720 RepID=A0A815KHE9_9BILA|nr:unnamed protein product [Adineta steineri]CAF4062017.1 unnamed protein product [Adineta steineri]